MVPTMKLGGDSCNIVSLGWRLGRTSLIFQTTKRKQSVVICPVSRETKPKQNLKALHSAIKEVYLGRRLSL